MVLLSKGFLRAYSETELSRARLKRIKRFEHSSKLMVDEDGRQESNAPRMLKPRPQRLGRPHNFETIHASCEPLRSCANLDAT